MGVLAIDQGTSATKAIVLDDDGIVRAEVEVPIHPVAGPGGAMEQDPIEMWDSVVAAGRQAIGIAGVAIEAVGLGNQGESVLAWDPRTGEPRSPVVVWQDRRSAPLCAALADHAEELIALSGLELDPYFVAPKLAWLQTEHPGPWRRTTTDAWLLRRLCGAAVTDAATASRSLLLDLDEVVWSERACDLFGLSFDDLPPVVGNAEPVGATTAFGTGPIPVTGLCVDQQAALFAQRCWLPGEAKCTFGTGAFLLANTGSTPTRSRSGLVGSVAWVLGGEPTWCLDGQVFTVGAAITWLIGTGIIDVPADLDRYATTVADTAGVTFVPGLAGLAAPFWRTDAKGSFTGLHLGTDRAHLVRAVVEGIAAQVAFLARGAATDVGRPLGTLRVDGGVTRSEVLMQLSADLSGCVVEVAPSPHATAVGVAGFARLGAGLASSPNHAVPPTAVGARYEPAVSADEAADRLARWSAVAQATIEL